MYFRNNRRLKQKDNVSLNCVQINVTQMLARCSARTFLGALSRINKHLNGLLENKQRPLAVYHLLYQNLTIGITCALY